MIVRKSKINWLLSPEIIVAFDKIQATGYNVYENPKQSLEEMKIIILQSKPDEYNNWVDVVELAIKKGMRGYGTRIPKIEES